MPPPKRILLMEDDPDYEQLVRAVLAGSECGFEVGSAPSLAVGLALIEQFAPQIILVDLNLSDSSGYETFLRVRERASGIPIIVLTALDCDQTALRAVEDGAQDYLVKSLVQPKLIARCLHMAVSRQNRQGRRKGQSSGPGTVLGFIGSKGGVGTSTVAVNVAALMAQNGLETLFIEFQLGRPGTSSLYLEAEPLQGLNSLLRNPPNTITESDLHACLMHAAYGLRMLCPAGSPGAGRPLGADYAHAILSVARRVFPFVVLDLPSRLDEGVAEALKLSDSITMIVDREASSLHCGRALIEQIRVASSRSREVHLAIVDRTGMQTPVSLVDIKNVIKLHPLVMVPPAASAIALSHSARTPLVLLCPDDAFSLAHVELAERLLPPSVRSDKSFAANNRGWNQTTTWPTIPETMYS